MANKKINQLVSKTAILSTDLFGIGDATTGQLFKKTIAELQAAIGGAVISVNGLVGTVVLDTDDIQELATPTNKYFTDARARGAISLTVTGNSGASTYSSGTGVLNVPTYTLAGLGGITASFLSGTSGISYNSTTGVISYSGTVYTDASIRALLSGATGISYNSTTGAISYSGTVYTDASVRALISITTTGTSGASTYNNTTGVINVPNYTLAGLGGISLTSLSGGTGITYNNTTGAISYSGTVYTDASVRALISASGAVSYNNTTGVISLTSGNLTEATSSVLTITGGTGAVLGSGTSIQVKQASSSVSGFLSSTDWSTFNGKASALSGTTNYISKFTSGTTIGNSNLINDANGNLGLGVTPSAWGSALRVIQGPNSDFVFTSRYPYMLSNGFFDTSWKYVNTEGASFYVQAAGQHQWFNAPSGTAGTAITFTQAMTLTAAGNLGVGTNTPNFNNYGTALSLLSASGYGGIEVYGSGSTNGGQIDFGSGSTRFASISGEYESATNGYLNIRTRRAGEMTNAVRITSAGNVGIGTSSPSGAAGLAFAINGGASQTRIALKNSTTGDAAGNGFQILLDSGGLDAAIENRENGHIRFSTGGGERGRITSGGNWLLGTSSDNGERLYISGNVRATGTITANSDLALKKNLLKIENALEKVEQINGYTYEFKANDSKRHAGVIAQEIQTVLPEIVNKGNDGILGVEYGNISALLIEAIKEQNTKIKNLETLLASK